MKAILIGAAALALTITTAGAEEEDYSSANVMLPYCKAYINETAQANPRAVGFCEGMIGTLAFMSGFLKNYPTLCIEFPSGVTLPQTAGVIVRYIEARPQRLHDAFLGLAIEALHDAWPCKYIP
jgi:Rap1a immunity proteins